MIKIKQKVSVLILVLIVSTLSILMTGCSFSTYNSSDLVRDYHKGSEGLVLSFLDQAPPKEVFENTPFDVQLLIANKGAFDVVGKYRAIVSLGYTPHYVKKITDQTSYNSAFSYIDKSTIQLYGKSYYFPEGQEDYFALDRFLANPIDSSYEKRTTGFSVSLYYPYETNFADEVCVDTDPNNIDERQQGCEVKDKSYSGGQGAPIAITAVESKMVPRGVYVQPIFIIHIKHLGKGSFYLPDYKTDSNGVKGPNLDGLGDDAASRVNISARLGSFDLECKPEEVFFKKNEATVQCRIPERLIANVGGNFLSTLQVNLKYLYSQSYTVDMDIKRSSTTAFQDNELPNDAWKCYPWQFYESSSGNCIDYCDYCAELSNRNNPHCIVSDVLPNDDTQLKKFTNTMTCAFPSATDCYEAGVHCILQKGFCPTGTYCGEPFCAYKPSKNHPPHITTSSEVSQDNFVFYCEDADANMGVQACGCGKKGFYKLVDSMSDCDSSIFHSEGVFHGSMVDGKQELVSGGYRMVYSIPRTELISGKYLCLGVKDLAGKYEVEKISLPI